MELLTQNLPSGYKDYPFNSLDIKPMTFADILGYMENLSPSPVGRFFDDYKLILDDDSCVDDLLLCDLEFVIFYKKLVTISKDIKYDIESNCPQCGSRLLTQINLNKIKFNRLDKKLLSGISVEFNGNYHNVSMPNVKQFMNIYSNYKYHKKAADLHMIKLVALFEDAVNPKRHLPHLYEEMVVNATYQDIAVLVMLDNAYYRCVKPVTCICEECKRNFDRLKYMKIEAVIEQDGLDKEERIRELEESEYKGVAIGIGNLIVNFFRDVVENNRLTDAQIVFREASEDEKRGDVHTVLSK